MKKTTVTITRYEDGSGSISGECEICGQFPCEHVTEQGYFAEDKTLKINTDFEMLVLKSIVENALAVNQTVLKKNPHFKIIRRWVATLKFLKGELEKLGANHE